MCILKELVLQAKKIIKVTTPNLQKFTLDVYTDALMLSVEGEDWCNIENSIYLYLRLGQMSRFQLEIFSSQFNLWTNSHHCIRPCIKLEDDLRKGNWLLYNKSTQILVMN